MDPTPVAPGTIIRFPTYPALPESGHPQAGVHGGPPSASPRPATAAVPPVSPSASSDPLHHASGGHSSADAQAGGGVAPQVPEPAFAALPGKTASLVTVVRVVVVVIDVIGSLFVTVCLCCILLTDPTRSLVSASYCDRCSSHQPRELSFRLCGQCCFA